MTEQEIAAARVLIRNGKHLLSVLKNLSISLKTIIDTCDTYVKAQTDEPPQVIENGDPLEHLSEPDQRRQ